MLESYRRLARQKEPLPALLAGRIAGLAAARGDIGLLTDLAGRNDLRPELSARLLASGEQPVLVAWLRVPGRDPALAAVVVSDTRQAITAALAAVRGLEYEVLLAIANRADTLTLQALARDPGMPVAILEVAFAQAERTDTVGLRALLSEGDDLAQVLDGRPELHARAYAVQRRRRGPLPLLRDFAHLDGLLAEQHRELSDTYVHTPDAARNAEAGALLLLSPHASSADWTAIRRIFARAANEPGRGAERAQILHEASEVRDPRHLSVALGISEDSRLHAQIRTVPATELAELLTRVSRRNSAHLAQSLLARCDLPVEGAQAWAYTMRALFSEMVVARLRSGHGQLETDLVLALGGGVSAIDALLARRGREGALALAQTLEEGDRSRQLCQQISLALASSGHLDLLPARALPDLASRAGRSLVALIDRELGGDPAAFEVVEALGDTFEGTIAELFEAGRRLSRDEMPLAR